MTTQKTDKRWEDSTKARVAGLLGLIGAVNLMDDYKEQEKQLKEGVEVFLKGNKVMVEDLLAQTRKSTLQEIKKKVEKLKTKKALKTFSGNSSCQVCRKETLSDIINILDKV